MLVGGGLLVLALLDQGDKLLKLLKKQVILLLYLIFTCRDFLCEAFNVPIPCFKVSVLRHELLVPMFLINLTLQCLLSYPVPLLPLAYLSVFDLYHPSQVFYL